MKEEILRLWEVNRPRLAQEMKDRLARGDIYILYDIQVHTNNLLRYACLTGDDSLLESMCGLYLLACPALTCDEAGMRWIYTDPSSDELAALLNQEIPLISSQFLFATAEAMRGVASLPKARRSPQMLEFFRAFSPVIADFYRRNYECFYGKMERALKMPYPPAAAEFDWALPVFDDYMFFLGGMAHLLAASAAAPELAGVAGCDASRYRAFLALGCNLLQKRLSESELVDFEGRPVPGMNFDLGVWDYFEDYAYAGYSGDAYPCGEDKRAAHNAGWDISHARRFVNAFDALYDSRAVTGLAFPSEGAMRALANQLLYGAFNGEFDRPLFSNFMDGTNGWYRVGYAGRPGFGYAPWGLSSAVPTGGYGFWSRFSSDVARVMDSVLALVNRASEQSVSVNSGGDAELVERWYPCLSHPDSLGRLMFLPSIAAVPAACREPR